MSVEDPARVPDGRLFLGAQSGREEFFECIGFRCGPAGYMIGGRVGEAAEVQGD